MTHSSIDVDPKDPILHDQASKPCPTGCGRGCLPKHVVCFVCWRRIPHTHQVAIYDTYRAWWRAVFHDTRTAADTAWDTHLAARAAALEALR